MEEKYKDWFHRHDNLMDELQFMLEGDSPPPPPPGSERKDVPWWPNRMTTAGATAFPLAMRDKEYIRDVVQLLIESGYNTVSVGAQTDGWADHQDPILPVGPTPGSEGWRMNLERVMSVTAQYENFYLMLTPTFTHKQRGGYEYQRHLCDKFADVLSAWKPKHVLLNIVNEFKHAKHPDFKDEHVLYLARELKERLGLPVSSDHFGKVKERESGRRVWISYYPLDWREFDFIAFHPPRNPEPNAREFEKASQRWSDRALLYNETTKYASTADLEQWPQLVGSSSVVLNGRGTEDQRRSKIVEIKRNIQAAGKNSRFFFHSHWLGIRCDPIGWIPEY
jgi:hypothetical protein